MNKKVVSVISMTKEEARLEDMHAALASILKRSDIDDDYKMALFQDLLAQINAFTVASSETQAQQAAEVTSRALVHSQPSVTSLNTQKGILKHTQQSGVKQQKSVIRVNTDVPRYQRQLTRKVPSKKQIVEKRLHKSTKVIRKTAWK